MAGKNCRGKCTPPSIGTLFGYVSCGRLSLPACGGWGGRLEGWSSRWVGLGQRVGASDWAAAAAAVAAGAGEGEEPKL
jgi:hypothetical protein